MSIVGLVERLIRRMNIADFIPARIDVSSYRIKIPFMCKGKLVINVSDSRTLVRS